MRGALPVHTAVLLRCLSPPVRLVGSIPAAPVGSWWRETTGVFVTAVHPGQAWALGLAHVLPEGEQGSGTATGPRRPACVCGERGLLHCPPELLWLG